MASSGLTNAFMSAAVAHVSIDVQRHYCDPIEASNIWTSAETLKDCAALADSVHGFANNLRGTAVKQFWVAHTPKAFRQRHPAKSPKQLALRELYEAKPEFGDVVISKTKTDAFWRTRFTHALKARGVGTLLLTGLYLDQCVMDTAQSALRRGFNVAVVEDLTYCLPRIRAATLKELEGHGAVIVSSADMLKLARA